MKDHTEGNVRCQPVPDRWLQKCPLCGQLHPIMMRGTVQDIEDGQIHVAGDRGYSFCNCRNIFYTDWANIKQSNYDDLYVFKYQCEDTKNLSDFECVKIHRLMNKFNPSFKTVFEIGCIHDYVLDYFKNNGKTVEGIDIASRKSGHYLIHLDFECFQPSRTYDLVWASHVIEHFKDPGESLKKIHAMLPETGLAYIAMPDTFFIDWGNPRNTLNWDWGVTEHHILWGMESFIEYAGEYGLKCVWCERNTDLNKQESGNWFWKKDFKALLCRK